MILTASISLLQFILYNFVQNHINMAFVLHCWSAKDNFKFAQMAGSQNIFLQYLNINKINISEDFEGKYLKHMRPVVAVYFDYNCRHSQRVLKKASEHKLFNHHYHWLIYDELADNQGFHDLFSNFQMAVDADLTYVYPKQKVLNTPGNTSFVSYDVYNNGYMLGGKLNMTLDREVHCCSNTCRLTKYLSLLYTRSKYDNRIVMEDITMRVSTVVSQYPVESTPPEVLQRHLRSRENIHNDGLAKFGFQYLLILRDSLRCNLFYNYTNYWGKSEVSGGVIGAVGYDQTAEMSSSPYLPTDERVKYSLPVMVVGHFRQVCMFRTPQNSGIKSFVFLEPFSIEVWWIFAGILSLFALMLWLTFFVEYHSLKFLMDYMPSGLNTSLISFGSACCQSSSLIPSSMGGRITFCTLSLLTFIMFNYYTSIVVSSLLGSPVKSNLKTMGQLADSNLEVGIQPMPYTYTYLNISELPEIQRFRKNKVDSLKNPQNAWVDIDEGIRRVRDRPGYAYVIEALSGYGLVEKMFTAQEICDLNEILFRPEMPLFFHLHRNTSYKEIVKLKEIRIFETGIYRQHYLYWVRTRLHCILSSNVLVQVGLEYTAPLFILLASAYILVLILILIEIMWKRYLDKENV